MSYSVSTNFANLSTYAKPVDREKGLTALSFQQSLGEEYAKSAGVPLDRLSDPDFSLDACKGAVDDIVNTESGRQTGLVLYKGEFKFNGDTRVSLYEWGVCKVDSVINYFGNLVDYFYGQGNSVPLEPKNDGSSTNTRVPEGNQDNAEPLDVECRGLGSGENTQMSVGSQSVSDPFGTKITGSSSGANITNVFFK